MKPGPSKKRRSPVVLVSGAGATRVDAIQATADYSDVDTKGGAYCRMYAGEVYVHSEIAVTVREIHARPEFNHVPFTAMEHWCLNDRWVERRKELQEAVRKRVEASIATDLAKARIDQLKQLMGIREKFNAVGMTTDEKGEIKFKLEPRSLESWVSALVKLDDHIGKLQGVVASILPAQTANALVPTGGGPRLSSTLRPHLSEEESLALALKLRDMRVAQDNDEVAKFQAEQLAADEARVATAAPQTPKATKRKPPAA